jgi:C1A family cysteine protease
MLSFYNNIRMKTLISLVILSIISLSFAMSYDNDQSQTILDSFSKGDKKTLFKVYHFIYNKEYQLNSIEGINKYKTFKANLKTIEEHNTSDSTYQMGINQLTDMTYSEIQAYYNLVPMTHEQVKSKLRQLNMFDEYVDEDETELKVQQKATWDFSQFMQPVRDQKSCGSCWAFTTMAIVEGMWNKLNAANPLAGWLSTQQLVDCDTGNNGCNGGWYMNALLFLQKTYANYDKDYSYTAKRGACQLKMNSPVKVGKFDYSYSSGAKWLAIAQTGPTAVAIDANAAFCAYRTGVWDGACATSINHAVTLIGFGTDATTKKDYYLIRNSWGTGWGEKGHIKMAVNAKTKTCNVENYAFAVSAYTK